MNDQFLYFGTQRSGPGTGLTRSTFDSDTGVIGPPELATVAPDPAFFVVSADRQRLYACHAGTPGGIGAYTLDSASGNLSPLNVYESGGRGPSHLSLDRTERFVLAANYWEGFVQVVVIDRDGHLGGETARLAHQGRSVHPERQARPHPHYITTDPSNRFALATDLGTDRIVIYRFDATNGSLTPHTPAHTVVKAGSGPRHLAWHPNGVWLYAIEELSNEVTAFVWKSDAGSLEEMGTVPTLPPDFQGENTAAEILVHPDGRFLYASNRGHDSVAAFEIEERGGRLRSLACVSSRGRTPRYMTFDATDRWLIVAHYDGDSVTVFRIDAATGGLAAEGTPTTVSRPFGVAAVFRH